jgi:hypothetical protein
MKRFQVISTLLLLLGSDSLFAWSVTIDNWRANEVEFALHTKEPFAGKRSMHQGNVPGLVGDKAGYGLVTTSLLCPQNIQFTDKSGFASGVKLGECKNYHIVVDYEGVHIK